MNAAPHTVARLCALLTLSCAALLAGCAAPAQKESMATPAISTTRKFPHSVRVEARGGKETGPMDTSNISDADLKAAVEDSIAKSGLFATVLKAPGADYELTVTVAQLTKPMFGASFTVTMEAGWSLVKVSDRSVVLRKSINSTYTATVSDAFIGATRLRLAVEGAVRENISQGLRAISDLPL